MGSSGNMCLLTWEMTALEHLHEEYASSVQLSSFVLSVATCVIGLLGNVIVICVAGCAMKKHQSKIWFLNLAVADLVFLLCLPLNAVAELKGNWPFGSPLCKTYNFLSIANMYASIFIITALNIDRALAVAKPIWHHKFFSCRVCYCICSLIWVITVLSSVPAIFLSNEVESKKKVECSLFDVEKVQVDTEVPRLYFATSIEVGAFRTFSRYLDQCNTVQCCADEKAQKVWSQLVSTTESLIIPLLLIGYFIPLCVIFISNIIIVLQVRKSKGGKPSRLYRIIVTVVMVYLLTWTPFVIAEIILLAAIKSMNITLVYKVVLFMPLLSSISGTHSCLNPVMYVLVGSKVRSRLVDFISSIRNSFSSSS
ncbi:chemerin-like receptor 1 [Pelodytes ibericus]